MRCGQRWMSAMMRCLPEQAEATTRCGGRWRARWWRQWWESCAGAARGCRSLHVLRELRVQFRQLGERLRAGIGRGKEERGAFYRGEDLREGLGFRGRGEIGRRWRQPCLGRTPSQGRRRIDRWAPPVSVCARWSRTASGEEGVGPGAIFWLEPDSAPRPFYNFFCSVFSFFYFLVCFKTFSKYLQNSLNQNIEVSRIQSINF
jgi:hypothetical protein